MDATSIRFDLVAGTSERRVFMHELSWWLRDHVGDGAFILDGIDLDMTLDWYILTADTHFKVLLTKENDVTMFMLRWS